MSDSPPSSPIVSATSPRSTDAEGTLLFWVIVVLYGSFTLLPDSSTRIVTWPWVALWQALLGLPVLWLLWQAWHKPWSALRLGNGLDGVAGLTVLGVVVSTLATEFPQTARWYGWAFLGGLAALYGLMGWLTPTRLWKLLKVQAYLAIALIVLSLSLWTIAIYRPALRTLQSLEAYGVNLAFTFDHLSLRNGIPLGHQNYVAGYLVLILPLLGGLAWHDKTRQRWLWLTGLGLGLLDLYTTHSRGGVLALCALAVPAVLWLWQSRYSPARMRLPIGLVGLAVLLVFTLTNPRLRGTLMALSQGQVTAGQLAYRLIMAATGWQMGQQRPWAGLGPGSVPLVFQAHRPFWAGREAELHYQLHSTPVHLWAELGLWGSLVPLLAVGLLGLAGWRHQRRGEPLACPPVLVGSLASGLWAYSVLSLTDYQLDVVAITGVLVVYLAGLLFAHRRSPATPPDSSSPGSGQRLLVVAGLGLTLAVLLWLLPLHRAWAASARGFIALQQDRLDAFVTDLEQAHRLAPWEAYYPFQLGWVLGDLSYRVSDAAVADALRTDAIAWFQQGNQVSPYQEFGHSNLGWLQTRTDAAAAISEFAQSAQLVPAKQGVFLGLGYSLLMANQPTLAIEAMTLEIIRHPRLLTSPLWRSDPFARLYPDLLRHLTERYDDLLTAAIAADDQSLILLWHQLRGTLHWWRGDYAAAAADWQASDTATGQALLAVVSGSDPDWEALPLGPSHYALRAWYEADSRQQWLERAWLTAQARSESLPSAPPPPALIERLVDTMAAATSLDQWLKQKAPSVEIRNERLGFGVLSRHDDGVNPFDYYVQVENVPMARFFADLVPSPTFLPALDRQLQPYREALLTQLPLSP